MSNTYHIPVLLEQSVSGLNIKPDGIYVDVTFGGGGHAKEILEKLTTGKLFAFDQDLDAIKNAETILENPENKEKFQFVRSNFSYIKNFLNYYGIEQVDGIFADLGVSSHQFDTAERGFSFRFSNDIDVDMRMNKKSELTAADILNNYSADELTSIFRNYGELKNPFKIVKGIIDSRNNKKITKLEELNEILNPLVPAKIKNTFFAKVYQALRIETNKELEALITLLEKSKDLLKPEGRLVVLTYHSLEDRLVKNFIKAGNIEGKQDKDIYGNVFSDFKIINKKVIIADDDEIKNNNRARSAKLRIAEKI